MKQLILHIGTHKTGTTSFQSSLEDNAEALIARGVRPVLGPRFKAGKRIPGKRANHMHFAHLLLRPEVISGARIRGGVPDLSAPQRRQHLDRLARRLAGRKEQTLVLSAEVLCFLRSADEQGALHRFVQAVGREVRTLGVFRKDADWRASWENQLRKHRRVREGVAGTGAGEANILGDWYFDKAAIREFWAPFNLCQIDYEAHANIVEALYREIGLPSGVLETDVFKNPRRQTDTPV